VSAYAILVMDDDDSIRQLVRMTLEDEGYAVLEAPDGVVGLDVLRSSSEPLVVLLDMRMPRLDGLGVLRTLAAELGIAARHAYVVSSGAPELLSIHLTFALRGKRFFNLPKPYDHDALITVVEWAAQQLSSERDEDDRDKVAVAEPNRAPYYTGG
jgi:CheY-like chemotaxis protein